MRSKEEIEAKIKELENADLDKMVFDEVEYGKMWLRWVLGKETHKTIQREKCLQMRDEEQIRRLDEMIEDTKKQIAQAKEKGDKAQ